MCSRCNRTGIKLTEVNRRKRFRGNEANQNTETGQTFLQLICVNNYKHRKMTLNLEILIGITNHWIKILILSVRLHIREVRNYLWLLKKL